MVTGRIITALQTKEELGWPYEYQSFAFLCKVYKALSAWLFQLYDLPSQDGYMCKWACMKGLELLRLNGYNLWLYCWQIVEQQNVNGFW